jgi:hypothetical protein
MKVHCKSNAYQLDLLTFLWLLVDESFEHDLSEGWLDCFSVLEKFGKLAVPITVFCAQSGHVLTSSFDF